MTNLSYKGRRVTDRLIEEAQGARAELSRMYKLGSLAYAGENGKGELTVNLGLNDRIASKPWGELKGEIVADKALFPEYQVMDRSPLKPGVVLPGTVKSCSSSRPIAPVCWTRLTYSMA